MNTVEYARLSAQLVTELREETEKALSSLIPETTPASLYDPARYAIMGGGKRLRPVLLLLTAKAFGVPVEKAMPVALAVEVFHNFTLVHDDIMDNADTRRGKPAVHAKWDEGVAILSGDYLMGLSYELLCQAGPDKVPELMQAFNRMVKLLCEGQALDTSFETRSDVTVDEYIHMIDRKTAALLEAVFEMGGILGQADEKTKSDLRLLGLSVGRAFQIQDDLLDITADNKKWGKKVGGDLIEGKKTYLLLRALEMIEEPARNFFDKIIMHNGLAEEKIPMAKQLLDDHGILKDAREAVFYHTSIADKCMSVFPESEAAKAIGWLIEEMQNRLH